MRDDGFAVSDAMLRSIWSALGGPPDAGGAVRFAGAGALESAFAVSDLAAASVAAAALAVAEFAVNGAALRVDRRLASFWFAGSIRPQGWVIPPAWDAIAGDYPTEDGWIRLHTNAPHHRAAALAVLGVAAEKSAVAGAVRHWSADALEAAIVAAGGCAAAMRSAAAWAAHPQGQAVAAEALIGWQTHPGAVADLRPVDPARPLAGIRVLDLTRILAGPVATRFLAGFGAEVLRIDPPDWEEPSLAPEVTLGKRCARLDLRSAAGRAMLLSLLEGADIVVHGYRPGALERLGLGAAVRRDARPGLVDVSLCAYGWSGPWAARRGFDSLVQMSGGIAEAGMRRFGRDRPTPLPVQALDHATGYMIAAAAMRGLTRRRTEAVGSTARLSLARTAALLAVAPAFAAPPLPPLTDADFSPKPEPTGWGAARRMLPPVALDGAAMRWDRPAGPLGSADPAWQDQL